MTLVDPPADSAVDLPDAAPAVDLLADEAVALARRLLDRSIELETGSERRRGRRLGRLIEDPSGRELLFALTDEVLRITDPAASATRFASIVGAADVSALGRFDSALLRVGGRVARLAPRLVMPLVVRRLRAETSGIVLAADDPALRRHLARRAADGVDLNVNPLGEAILSDAEADERMRRVIEQVQRPDVDHVSVKASAVVAHLDPLAIEDGVDRIADRVRQVLRAGVESTPTTFVNLDMEEYRDLELTCRAFMRVLDEPEFERLDAGIVMQAYLPDSHAALARLGAWAAERHHRAGGRIRVRVVKGANLAMERVEAELHGWVPAPYPDKAAVDASYKALLESALDPEWADAVLVGVASHHLFDLAWAHLLAERLGQRSRVRIEMLEGMAPAQARAVRELLGGELRLYAPVVADDDFVASLAYLTRRLDENTQPDNFLRSLFRLAEDRAEFDHQAERFRRAIADRTTVDRSRRRRPIDVGTSDTFANEPDADVTDADTRYAIRSTTAPAPSSRAATTPADVDETLARLHGAAPDPATRRQQLLAVAHLMSSERAETLALMAHPERGVGKTYRQGDPEVSEAVDFCRYYGTVGIDSLTPDPAVADLVHVESTGVVAVIAPWNFPYAIPTGGVAAALAAGNRVVLKPAPEAVHVGAWIVEQFRRAGVDESRLQLVVCDDDDVGRHLVTHDGVDSVILTGSYETAQRFLDWTPCTQVFAETSGKNALVITAAADLDLAISDLVASAFGHAGQKCSAASLGIIEASVYDDPSFRRRLADAVRSLRVGAADDPTTIVGPLIGAPGSTLERALTRLDPGETWLVEPRQLDERTWTPGVRLDVAPGSWFHRTECFGPVLGLMRADDLEHALALQNATDFALTTGPSGSAITEVTSPFAAAANWNNFQDRLQRAPVVTVGSMQGFTVSFWMR
ncbi:MAG: bifunctional proline dehydrogenase/L-glutamate gamma-semialdehyde dehydrogenase, partial [Actinomycetota bacterium]